MRQSACDITRVLSEAGTLRGDRSAVGTDHPEGAASVTIIAAGYSAHCTAPHCKNLGRMILRYNDSGGRPTKISEFCRTHTIRENRASPPGRAQGLRSAQGFVVCWFKKARSRPLQYRSRQ